MPRPDHFPAEGWLLNIASGGGPELQWTDDRKVAESFEDRQHYMAVALDWTKVVRAIAHPKRMEIVKALAGLNGPVTAEQVQKMVDGSLANVQYHLSRLLIEFEVLEGAGRDQGPRFPRLYRLVGS